MGRDRHDQGTRPSDALSDAQRDDADDPAPSAPHQSPPSAPRFGWSPDDVFATASRPAPPIPPAPPPPAPAPPVRRPQPETRVVTQSERREQPARHHAAPPLAPAAPAPNHRRHQQAHPFHTAQPAQRRRRRAIGVPRFALHLLVLATVAAVVAGGGYWDHRPQAPTESPSARADTDTGQLGELPTTIGTTGAEDKTASLTVASSSSDATSGYLTQFASAVIPAQLRVQTVVATGGESIADIAKQTGLKINTLLWANGLADPAQPLADGTQVRVPPVDGMLHVIHDGDTLESIAARYQVDVSAITGYEPNNVQTTADLVPYRMLMVPGGTMPTRDKVVTYIVRDGDTLATIAQFFGLRPNTILWANSLPNGNLIFPGQHLAILPADGVMVTVKDGDTVDSLASTYNVEAKAIRDYPGNGLGTAGTLRSGQQVMIPGGTPPKPPEPTPTPVPPAPAPAPAPAPQQASAPAPAPQPSSGHFIWPTSGTITQYYGPTSLTLEPAYLGYAHFHQGLDIANNMYTPIVAADAGTVTFAGWTTIGYGYAVQIDHGNGLATWYGHMAQMPAVQAGQHVSQGQYIGPMGSTGASTGPHVHFGVLKNGVWDDPIKYLP